MLRSRGRRAHEALQPRASPASLRALLVKTADDLGGVGFDNDHGWGTPNTTALLAALKKVPTTRARWWRRAIRWLVPGVMMTVELDPDSATVGRWPSGWARPEEIDAEFGVVPIDPDNHLYTVLVDEQASARVAGQPGVEGPFSNPRIEPFGPPQP